LKNAAMANQPVIPCLTCHAMHRLGKPLGKPAVKPDKPGPGQELYRPSLALFDRREFDHLPNASLPLPRMLENERVVKISPDPRQALCYQCHAALASAQADSGDDRTPIGVHEGISCLACHQKHRQTTRASCADCHPRLSNCGIDVEKMDTTFLNTKSAHDVHFVKCEDCHPKGVPPKRRSAYTPRRLP
jgi:RNase P subunit RPR2